jgi:IS30 family transposase
MLITRKYPGLPTITPTAVYNWLFSTTTAVKRELRQLLIRPRVQRRPRKKTVTRQGKIPNMRPISQRPAGAEDRSEFGHWEGDLMIGVGGRSAIATLVERKTRVTLLIKVPNRTSQAVVTCVARRLQTSQAVIKSITWDQGKELTNHNELTRLTGAPVFFADAHSPWQRGSNENSNGITRRWHPKGTSFDIHPAKLRTTQQRLNNRPMPVLSGATPQETYAAEINMQ